MKALLHSNHPDAVAATERTLQMLAGTSPMCGSVSLARNTDGSFAFEPDEWIMVRCTNPEFIAWSALRQGYVAAMKTDPGETARLALICAGGPMEPEPPKQWPKRSGMKQHIAPVLKHACQSLSTKGLETPSDDMGHVFVLEEFLRNLQELADRFYSGDAEVIDEFLQLYCLDRKREGLKARTPPPGRRLGNYHFIAHSAAQLDDFRAKHGISRQNAIHVSTLRDVHSINTGTRIYRLPGASLEGDLERVAAARRLLITSITPAVFQGLQPFTP